MGEQSMPKIAYIADDSDLSETQVYSDEFQKLMTRWERLEAQTAEFTHYSDGRATGFNMTATMRAKLAKLADEIETEQRNIFDSFATRPALLAGDMLAKLKVWKMSICPSPEDEKHLQPAERIILSVYEDLLRAANLPLRNISEDQM